MTRILIAEDDVHLRTILRMLLEEEGYEVLTAEDGEETLYLVDIHNPDLAILDVDIGDSSYTGFDLIKEIRQRGDAFPIILLTALPEEEGVVQGFAVGADDYVTKPFRARELLARVARRLQTRPVSGRTPGSKIIGQDVYEIVEKIREGGMGVVYKARRQRDGAYVAAKFLHAHCLVNRKEVERFKREAQAAILLSHPNLAKGYELIVAPNQCCLLMEYVAGETVSDILKREGCLSPAASLDIVIQITRALICLHQADLIHRDIKPENIIITPTKVAKLVDFGLARSIHANWQLTTRGIILGTPYYLAPEQARGGLLDIRCDIYSLGLSFYHMVTGKIPFEHEPSTLAMINARLTRDPDPPDICNAAIPAAFSQVICKMIARNKQERYRTPGELLQALVNLKLGP